jgi:hypothetical protein
MDIDSLKVKSLNEATHSIIEVSSEDKLISCDPLRLEETEIALHSKIFTQP